MLTDPSISENGMAMACGKPCPPPTRSSRPPHIVDKRPEPLWRGDVALFSFAFSVRRSVQGRHHLGAKFSGFLKNLRGEFSIHIFTAGNFATLLSPITSFKTKEMSLRGAVWLLMGVTLGKNGK